MQFRKSCLEESISLQKKIIQSEKLLFALNPLSTFLQTDLITKEILLASAAIDPILAAEIEAEIIWIKKQQALLDEKQKLIIAKAELFIQLNQDATLAYLNKNANSTQNVWSYYLKKIFTISIDQRTKFAVKAMSSGMAPNYGLAQDYKRLQVVAYNWHLQLLTITAHQNILNSNNAFTMSCGTTANNNGVAWSIEIIRDRYSSNPFSQ